MPDKSFISKITLPKTVEGQTTYVTYELKDLEARSLIETLEHIGLKFVRSVDAASTPLGVTWTDGSTVIVGTLQPSAEIRNIYLVPETKSIGKSTYVEYVCVLIGKQSDKDVFAWEAIGSTDASLDELGDMAYADTATGTATFTGHTGVISSSGTFTAEGTVSRPAVDVTAPKATFSAGTLPTKAADTFTQGSLPSKDADTFTQGTLPSKAADTFTQGSLPSKNADTFTQGTLPSKAADTFSAGSTPIEMDVVGETLTFTLGTAPSFTEGTFNAGTLPTFSEGTFDAGTLPTFSEGTFDAGTLPTFTEGAFHEGDLPTYSEGTFTQGTLPGFKDSNEAVVSQLVMGVTAALHEDPTFKGTPNQPVSVSSSGNSISTTGTVQVTPDSGNH